MNFAKHSNLEGQHAFLSASGYHWINYSEEKIADAYAKYRAAQRGMALHAFAAQCIKISSTMGSMAYSSSSLILLMILSNVTMRSMMGKISSMVGLW